LGGKSRVSGLPTKNGGGIHLMIFLLIINNL
jgi:hypothetical protein